MHIAFLTPEYPHPRVRNAAGIGTSVKNLALGILEENTLSQKHTISIIVYGQEEDATLEEQGIKMYLIKQKSYGFGGFYRYRKHLNRQVNKLVRENAIDLIEAPDWTGITAFMKFKVPLVIRLHGTDTYFCALEKRTQKKKNYFFEKQAFKNASAITSVSAFTANQTKELFNLDTDITVIHNLINASLFCPRIKTSEQQRILYFGSIIRKKGVLALAKAFNVLIEINPEVRLLFLGKDVKDSKEQKSTIELIKELLSEKAIERIQFISQVPYEQVQEYIGEASVVCLPSYAEAFPMTWLEAMAMEKPMVTSNIGWAPEIMEDQKTGLLVDPDQTEDLANALNYLLKNREVAEVYGKNARKRLLDNFSREDIVAQNMTFYKKVLSV